MKEVPLDPRNKIDEPRSEPLDLRGDTEDTREVAMDPEGKDSFSEILGKLEKALEQENLEDFLEERIEKLINESEAKSLSRFSSEYGGFLHPESEIESNPLVRPFRISEESMKEISNIFSGILQEIIDNIDSNFRTLVLFAVQNTVNNYFENLDQVDRNDSEKISRQKFYDDRSNQDYIDINEFKGLGVSKCSEKAAVAQNLWSIFGADTELIFSSNCEISGSNADHLFNIVRTDNRVFICDTENPPLHHVANYSTPGVYPLSEEQVRDLKDGGSVEVQLRKDVENPPTIKYAFPDDYDGNL